MGLFSQRAEVCLVYDQVINVSLSLHRHHYITHSFLRLILHTQPSHHNEVVPGGEAVEGERVTLFVPCLLREAFESFFFLIMLLISLLLNS